MSKHVVIVGAVAVGPKTACRLRRLDPEIMITVLDRDNLISYGGCGIPYYIGEDIAELEQLQATAFHVVRDDKFFRLNKDVKILPRVEAVAIDRKGKKLEVRYLEDGRQDFIKYDKLVIGTGATSFIPPISGVDLPKVFTVSNLHSAKNIKDQISKGNIGKAVIIGGGAIGIEVAEALTDLWGVETTIVEMADHLLPVALGNNMSKVVERELERHGVKVLLSESVRKINGDAELGVTSVDTTSDNLKCDMVIICAGVRPNTEFAARSGLAVGRSGGLIVDRGMRTSDPDIYAGGDCVEIPNLVGNYNVTMPLGSLANRQGRVIADNIYGRSSQFKGSVGTFCIKVFNMSVATAGLTVDQAKAAGFDPVHAVVSQADRAHFYPSAKLMFVQLIADRKTRKILGIQSIGSHGDAVKSRVDSVAPFLQAGIDVSDICTLETGYSPPYASAIDIINNAGNALDNILEDMNKPIDPPEFIRAFKKGNIQVIDVREENETEAFVNKYGKKWLNIPQSRIREHLNEIPQDRQVCIVCGTGARSYECQSLLLKKGFRNIVHLQGGQGILLATDPGFI